MHGGLASPKFINNGISLIMWDWIIKSEKEKYLENLSWAQSAQERVSSSTSCTAFAAKCLASSPSSTTSSPQGLHVPTHTARNTITNNRNFVLPISFSLSLSLSLCPYFLKENDFLFDRVDGSCDTRREWKGRQSSGC